SAGDPRAASQPRSGQPPPGLSQPSPVEPASPSPDPLAGRSSRSGTALPGAAADDGPVRDPALPPTAAGPSDADLADATPPQPSGPAIATGMRLAMRVVPADAFVLLDGTVVGKAAQFGARSPLLLPSPGEHRITLRRAGMADRHLRIVASESGAGVSPILATLQPLAAGETPFHELEVHRVGKAVAFRVDPPTTRVLVDGVDHGLAARYRGGRFGGGNWLELPLGLHRVSLVAPGHRRLDVVVDVTSGAEEERRVVRLRLPPLPEGAP
ncbi:MAG TPA: hypothetical protein VHQ65_16415, partial [Thermoanaerobaculia bacterium]|nr:hypothetical protein [Thermoanaerobaculia bacterium]